MITFHLLRITIHVLILRRITLHEVTSEYLKILNKHKNDTYLLVRGSITEICTDDLNG